MDLDSSQNLARSAVGVDSVLRTTEYLAKPNVMLMIMAD